MLLITSIISILNLRVAPGQFKFLSANTEAQIPIYGAIMVALHPFYSLNIYFIKLVKWI